MARPKKLSDADAVRLVDSLYEQCGDHTRLKFSELEKHAALLDMDVRAYDLRRNAAVLRRIAEIEALSLNADRLAALAYKGLDIGGFILSNRTPDKLRHGLAELDGRWRKLYDYAVSLSRRVSTLSDELRKSEDRANGLEAHNVELSEKEDVGRSLAADLKAENAYLRKTFRKYLYPALADSVLASLGEFSGSASGATQAAIDTMTDGNVPAPLSASAAAERELRPREDILLEGLRLQVLEGGYDAP